MKKKKLLFVTLGGGYMEAGFQYARELAGTLEKNISVLVVVEKKFTEKLQDIFAASALAESYGADTPEDMLSVGFSGKAEKILARLKGIISKSDLSGVVVEVYAAEGEITKMINAHIEKDPDVEMVLLGPSVADAAAPQKTMKKIAYGISRPVVTMARQNLTAN